MIWSVLDLGKVIRYSVDALRYGVWRQKTRSWRQMGQGSRSSSGWSTGCGCRMTQGRQRLYKTQASSSEISIQKHCFQVWTNSILNLYPLPPNRRKLSPRRWIIPSSIRSTLRRLRLRQTSSGAESPAMRPSCVPWAENGGPMWFHPLWNHVFWRPFNMN